MTFCVIYLVSDKLERRIHAVNRAANPIKEEQIFEERDKSEDATFYEFENLVQCASEQETFPSNITTICSVENDYGDGLLDAVKSLMNHKRMHDNVVKMAKALAEIGIIDKDPSDENKVYLGTEDIVTYDYFADIVIKDEKNFASFTHEYLSNFDI